MLVHVPAGPKQQSHKKRLEQIVFGIDALLRRRHLVVEYSSDPNCVLRINIGHLDTNISLSDGTRGSAGDALIDLHFWNEQVPIMPRVGPTIAWARQMHLCFLYSLRALAQYLNTRSEYHEVSILRATVVFGASEQNAQVVRLMSRYGFEPALGSTPPRAMRYARRVGENLLISLMVLAHNGPALRRDTLRRDRIHVFLSRQMLERRYGSDLPRPQSPKGAAPKSGSRLC